MEKIEYKQKQHKPLPSAIDMYARGNTDMALRMTHGRLTTKKIESMMKARHEHRIKRSTETYIFLFGKEKGMHRYERR